MTYNKLIQYLKLALYTVIIILGGVFLLATLYYFNIINKGVFNILKIIWIVISIFISSLSMGKKTSSKGYLAGLKLALILILILFIFKLVFRCPVNFKTFIYYLIIIGTAVFGSMVGISKKQDKIN